MNNNTVRDEFNKWWDDMDKPSLPRVTKRIGINYDYFLHWRAGRKNMGDDKLNKVIKHIRK